MPISKGTYCPSCTMTLENNNIQIEKGYFIFGLVGFIFPLMGIILFAIMKNTQVQNAKTALIGAIISIVIQLLLMVLFILFAIFIL